MPTTRKTILIIDDSPLIVNRLTEMLAELTNIEWVKTAGNYEEALHSIDENQPDVLLLDINLPDKSGIDVLRKFRQTNVTSKVIMITNQANEFYSKLCMRLGANYFIDKSKEFERIAEIIASLD